MHRTIKEAKEIKHLLTALKTKGESSGLSFHSDISQVASEIRRLMKRTQRLQPHHSLSCLKTPWWQGSQPATSKFHLVIIVLNKHYQYVYGKQVNINNINNNSNNAVSQIHTWLCLKWLSHFFNKCKEVGRVPVNHDCTKVYKNPNKVNSSVKILQNYL